MRIHREKFIKKNLFFFIKIKKYFFYFKIFFLQKKFARREVGKKTFFPELSATVWWCPPRCPRRGQKCRKCGI